MKQEDEWGEDTSRGRKMGEYTWAKEKMGGVLLREGKNGRSILRGRKKWGEYTLAAEGRAIMSTPPSGCFWHLPLEKVLGSP